MTFNNTTIANDVYPVANGTTSTGAFVVVFQNRDPTTSDVQYPIQKIWLNTTTENFWFLENFTTLNGVLFAHWVPYKGATTIESLTGDDLLPIGPVSNNIDVFGNAVANATHAKPIFFKHGSPLDGEIDLDVQVSNASPSSNINNAGISSFNDGHFSVDANGYVGLKGGGQAVDSLGVDASTPPGTNPVLPTVAGLITVTGAQVAAGTTTNVIRTDSLAASILTVEIQRSQAVASTTIGDNGVSHFNSSHFTVDANGFVSLSGGGQAIDSVQVDAATGPGTNPVVPTVAGLITVTGGQVAAGTTTNVIRTDSLAANTYTVEVQRSQAVASTTVGDNGVCHFDSGVFSVDANGFVSTASGFYTTATWTPALSFAGGNTGLTYTTRAGEYTRIGNVVLFSFYILLSSKGSSTGAAQVDGLPFVGGGALPANSSYMNFSAGNLPTESYQTLTQMNFGSGSFLLDYSSGTAPCATTMMDDTNFNNNTELLAQGFIFI